MARALIKNASNSNPPNLVINGGMDFWQRSLGPVTGNATPAYLAADRFQIEIGGAGNATIQRSTTVPDSTFKYSARFTSTSGTNSFQLWQRIEAVNVKPYVGKTVTLSAWVMQTGEMDDVALSIRRPAAGTDDTWASENDVQTLVISTPFAVAGWTTGVWRRISTSVVLPNGATNGLVIGVEGTDVSTAGASRYVTGVMLTEGPATPASFYRTGPTIQQELALCQRYYEKSYQVDVAPTTNTQVGFANQALGVISGAGVSVSNTMQYLVYKRAIPNTLTFYRDTGVDNSWITQSSAGGTTARTPSLGMSGPNGFLVQFTTTDPRAYGHWAVDAEL